MSLSKVTNQLADCSYYTGYWIGYIAPNPSAIPAQEVAYYFKSKTDALIAGCSDGEPADKTPEGWPGICDDGNSAGSTLGVSAGSALLVSTAAALVMGV